MKMTTFPLKMASIFAPSFSNPLMTSKTRLSMAKCHIKAPPSLDPIRPELVAHRNVLHTEKVEIIKQTMKELPECSLEELEMIDAIQRLGIEYLFYQEIDDALQMHNARFCNQSQTDQYCGGHELHEVALRFRLLRQSGYNVSSDLALTKFKNNDGKFMSSISGNAKEVMSLFEASQLGIQGEDTLDEANKLCIQRINSMLGEEVVDQSHTRLQNFGQLSHTRLLLRTLKHPHHKSLARFMANDLLFELKNGDGWRIELTELAKLEYDGAQKSYMKDISFVSIWWETIGLAKEIKLTRDQPLKWYTWSLAAIQDPNLSEQRIELTKPISLVYIIDDIFDVHGVHEHLSLFAEAVKRWNFDGMENLPKYMKFCLKVLFNTTNEISQSICSKYGWDPERYLRKEWEDLVYAHLMDSEWSTSGYIPTSEEYLKLGMITSSIPLLGMHLFFLLGGKNNESPSQISSESYHHKIISSTTIIFRLWNDLGCGKEQEGGKDGSYLMFYMNEHEGISLDDAREHIVDLMLGEWKSINKSLLLLPQQPLNSPTHIFTQGCLNFARTIPLMYSYDDDLSLPDLQKFINLLLFQKYI